MQRQHKKRNGERCGASALTGQSCCAMHNLAGPPSLVRRGGRRRAAYKSADLREFAAPKTAADLRDLLAESIIEIPAGKLDPRFANALGISGCQLPEGS